MVRHFVLSPIVCVVAIAWNQAGVFAQQGPEGWPQFRGPDGQGHVTGPIPTTWSKATKPLFTEPIPGKGWSSAVIRDGKVWLTTSIDAKPGASLRILAFDQETGKKLHDIELFAVAKANALHARNTQASPTPVIEKGRLYAHFGSYGTACIDTDAAKILWKNESLVVDHETGPASSPVLYKDLLICTYDGADKQFVAGLNKQTGEVAWKTDRPEAVSKAASSRRSFCTPLIFTFAGKDQIVIPGAHCIYSYDPQTGKDLWRVKTNGFSNVPRPVFAQGLIITTTGFAPPDLIAIRPDGEGDVTKTHVAWRLKKNVPNIPSPLAVGDNLFIVADSGTATCLDIKTGKVHWSERLGGTFSASPFVNGSTIYAFGDDGTAVLFEASNTYKEIRRNEIQGKVQATPAVAGNCLFVRTEQNLIKLGQ